MVNLSPTQSEVLAIIWEWQDAYKNSPFMIELARRTGMSQGGILSILQRLQAYGYIDLIKVGKRLLIVPIAREGILG